MIPQIFKLVGGIGVFLMRIVLLTGGLKSFVGDVLTNAIIFNSSTETTEEV